jgi:hypothetical protein
MISLRPILQLCLLASALCLGSKPSAAMDATPLQDPTASALPEVRLRKLHLVRPDLIPYPIFYETFC